MKKNIKKSHKNVDSIKKIYKKQKAVPNNKKQYSDKLKYHDGKNAYSGSKVASVFGIVLGFCILITSLIMIVLMDNKEQHSSLPSVILMILSVVIFIFNLISFINAMKIKNKIKTNTTHTNNKIISRLQIVNIIAYSTSLISLTLTLTTYITWFVEKI